MINAGKYSHKIEIIQPIKVKDSEGFTTESETSILVTWAEVKTTSGFTLIASGSDFEKAFTRFTIRFPSTKITRKMMLKYNNKYYSIEYLNNVDEKNVELEIQAKVVEK